MVSHLNFTPKLQAYFPAYCLSPLWMTVVLMGIFSTQLLQDSSHAGPLVRISAYLINIFVALLIFHSPEELRELFRSQILAMYSLLITCGISIFLRKLTGIHAIMTTMIAGSPLSVYIIIYAIRSVWGDANRLNPVLGPRHVIPRTLVLTALLLWGGLVVYIIWPSNIPHFAQLSWERYGQQNDQIMIKHFYFSPIVLIVKANTSFGRLILTPPIQLTALVLFIAILRRRREIWPRGEKYSPRFYRVWRVVNDNYPFVQFTTVIFIPFVYWGAIIEMGAWDCNDNQFSATFGQVLALFVTLPPMIQVVMLTPRFCDWFIDLAWVRLLTSRPPRTTQGSGSKELIPLGTAHRRYDDDKEPALTSDYSYKTVSVREFFLKSGSSDILS